MSPKCRDEALQEPFLADLQFYTKRSMSQSEPKKRYSISSTTTAYPEKEYSIHATLHSLMGSCRSQMGGALTWC